MKKIIIICSIIVLVILLIANNMLKGQELGSGSNGENLVPNFSFEQYDTCPNMADQIQYAIGWRKYSMGEYPGQQFNTYPVYYNACAKPGHCSVPYTGDGYRPDNRNCNGFAGLTTISSNSLSYRDYIGIQLSQSLIIGQKYYISFYVAASLQYISEYYFGLWTNNIGIKLSTIAYSGKKPAPIDNFAHLRSTTIIKDTINWHLISGSIIADSAYDYLIVGNFYDNAHTDTLNYNCVECLNEYGFYYIDDICLSTDSALCNGGIEKMI